MPDTVLILGAEGFVGRSLAAFCEVSGYQVVRYRRKDAPLSDIGATVVPSHVVNAAGRTFVPASWEDPVPFYADNVMLVAEALELCRRVHASFVHLSAYVYGVPETVPISESHSLSAVNPYAHSKIMAESLVEFYRNQMAVPAIIIRPFNLYGPGQSPRFLVPSVVRQLLQPDCHEVRVADLRPRRDYLYIDDLSAFVVAAIRSHIVGTYNIGSGTSISVEDLVREAFRVCGIDKPIIETGPNRPNEILNVVADIRKACSALGWAPRISLGEGLRRLVASDSTSRLV